MILVLFAALYFVVKVSKNPFIGLLVMIGVNPFESLINVGFNISLGRIIGTVSVIGWFVYLYNNPQAMISLSKSVLIRVIWAFPIICLLGIILNENQTISGYQALFKLFILLIMSVMVENLVISKNKMYQLVFVVAISAVFASVFPIASFFEIDLYTPFGLSVEDTMMTGRTSGLTNNANALGLATCMGLFALLVNILVTKNSFIKILLLLLGVFMIGGLILSGSRTHLVAYFVCILSFGILRFFGPTKGLSSSLLLLPVMILIFMISYQAAPEVLKNRFILFGKDVGSDTVNRQKFADLERSKALEIVQGYPLGVGLTGFEKYFGAAAHDTISALLGETGLLGSIAFSWIALSSWQWLYRANKIAKRRSMEMYYYSSGFISSYIAMFVAGWGGYVIYNQRWFWIIVGISPTIYKWSKSFNQNQASIIRVSNHQMLKYSKDISNRY